MLKILVLAFFAIFLGTANAQCGLESCGDGEHIDCYENDTLVWNPSCPATKNYLNLAGVTDDLVGRHNYHRNRIAGGLITGFPTAKRMGAMSWNISLANLCRKNLRQCALNHDECHNTLSYNFTGQNLGSKKFRKTVTTPNVDILKEITDYWYDSEIGLATKDDFNPYKGNMAIATVAQVLRDTCGLVGCAAIATEDATWRTVFYCCNYAMGNIKNWPTYQPGPIASACKTGKDGTYKNLCSTSEPYNYQAFWEDV